MTTWIMMMQGRNIFPLRRGFEWYCIQTRWEYRTMKTYQSKQDISKRYYVTIDFCLSCSEHHIRQTRMGWSFSFALPRATFNIYISIYIGTWYESHYLLWRVVMLYSMDCSYIYIYIHEMYSRYGALMWSMGKVMKTPEVMRVFIGSFWDQVCHCVCVCVWRNDMYPRCKWRFVKLIVTCWHFPLS